MVRLVWSGDIASSWISYRNQLAAGLNMGLAGILGGRQTSADFTEVILMMKASGSFLSAGFNGERSAPSCVFMVTVSPDSLK